MGWHQKEIDKRLEDIVASNTSEIELVDQPEGSDCCLRLHGPTLDESLDKLIHHKLADPNTFVWDEGDQPTGRWPGLYCSLPRTRFDPRFHRAFCYRIVHNECVEAFDLENADYLWGFMGGITAPVRSRLVEALKETPSGFVRVQGGPWRNLYNRKGVPEKIEYAEVLRRCRFFLCPRGNGTGSVRLFETMKAARVPVIISDPYVLPEGIDWEACSVRVAENQVHRIPQILESYESRWQEMALNARAAWEAHYSDAHLLGEIGRHLQELLARNPTQTAPPYWGYLRRLAPAFGRRVAVRGYQNLQRLRRRLRSGKPPVAPA